MKLKVQSGGVHAILVRGVEASNQGGEAKSTKMGLGPLASGFLGT